jgi:hypothetical protein
MARILLALLAGVLGALVAAGLLLLSTGAPFFAPQAYADANDWFGLALIGDLELVIVSYAVLFALAALISDGPRTFAFMTAGFGLSSLLMAASAYGYRPAPRSLTSSAQIWAVALWIGLSVVFALMGRAWARRSRPRLGGLLPPCTRVRTRRQCRS